MPYNRKIDENKDLSSDEKQDFVMIVTYYVCKLSESVSFDLTRKIDIHRLSHTKSKCWCNQNVPTALLKLFFGKL